MKTRRIIISDQTSHPECDRRIGTVIGHDVGAARPARRDDELAVLPMLGSEHGHKEAVLDAVARASARALLGRRRRPYLHEAEPAAPGVHQRAPPNISSRVPAAPPRPQLVVIVDVEEVVVRDVAAAEAEAAAAAASSVEVVVVVDGPDPDPGAEAAVLERSALERQAPPPPRRGHAGAGVEGEGEVGGRRGEDGAPVRVHRVRPDEAQVAALEVPRERPWASLPGPSVCPAFHPEHGPDS